LRLDRLEPGEPLAACRARVYRPLAVSARCHEPFSTTVPVAPRRLGRANLYGVKTLYIKELRRFLKMPVYTLCAPLVTGLLFLTVFTLALGDVARGVGPVPLADFLIPGLAMMALIQTSFENPASSLLSGKLTGAIADLLVAPLSPAEITAGIVLGGATRGLIVGSLFLTLAGALLGGPPAHPAIALFHAVAAAVSFAALGTIAGLWAAKWDHLAALANFTLMPLIFLSGTFYSIDRLPGAWRVAGHFDPVFYMIDGFRYGIGGVAGGSLAVGFAVMTVLPAALVGAAYWLVRSGYRVKA